MTLEELRADFGGYVKLDEEGRLPSLAEEVEDAAAAAVGGGGGGLFGLGGGGGVLGGLTTGDEEAKRRERRASGAAALEAKKLRLAATVATRASKDAADAAVYGVLPTAKAAPSRGRQVWLRDGPETAPRHLSR
mmetsp:Transcript_44140/g.141851  ORF Transcript_44140/g.141851 Transcript_44140/m.141851 type:complete len:134 (+) Transcript_44140:409-810(+)